RAVTAAAVSPAASSATVMIKNYAFSPAALTVKVGTTVTWTNMDTAPHTVTVSSGPVKFSSPNLQKGQSFTYTFTKAGTYSYYCAVHPDMTATVTVTGSGSTPVTPTPAPTPAPAGGGHGMPMPSTDGCDGGIAALNALLQHVYSGHLEASPGQQVQDITNVDQYVKTHTVLVENMLKPLVGGGEGALNALLQHIYSGHLEASPGQQVQDITDVNQYVKTHTVLVENIVKDLVGGESAC
ncbi:MAG: cupredoxin family copper-binding protein, partial [Marmoricola sp.]